VPAWEKEKGHYTGERGNGGTTKTLEDDRPEKGDCGLWMRSKRKGGEGTPLYVLKRPSSACFWICIAYCPKTEKGI